jgi:hypothetical protein
MPELFLNQVGGRQNQKYEFINVVGKKALPTLLG